MAKGITELIADFKELHPCAYKRIRDTAIDEFAERLKEKYGCLGYIDEIKFEEVDKIAEQMKAGGKND